jgi:hypothetical protein
MKKLSTLKTLPLIGLLAMGLALPAVSMADRDDHRGRDHVYKKHDGGKGHKREHRRIHRDGKGQRDHSRHYSKGHKHGGHNKHVYSRHYKHGHKHYGHKGHRHGHGHKHVDHVVVHNHYDDWDDYDRLRLMLGLHFDNIDIIYRDY